MQVQESRLGKAETSIGLPYSCLHGGMVGLEPPERSEHEHKEVFGYTLSRVAHDILDLYAQFLGGLGIYIVHSSGSELYELELGELLEMFSPYLHLVSNGDIRSFQVCNNLFRAGTLKNDPLGNSFRYGEFHVGG